MTITIPFYCAGLLLTDVRTGINGYVHGTQNVSMTTNIGSLTHFDTGRSQNKTQDSPSDYTLNIERVLCNYDEGTDYVIGPLLHYIFSIASSSFPYDTGPVSYRNSHLLNYENLGYAKTGSSSSDLREFDFDLAYKSNDNSFNVGSVIQNLSFRRFLLKDYKISIEPNVPIIESSSYVNGEIFSNTTNFSKDKFDIGEMPLKDMRIIRGNHLVKSSTYLPSTLSTLVQAGVFVSGTQVLGITKIELGFSIDYSKIQDYGNFRGLSQESDMNLWTCAQVPITINCVFDVDAQQHFQSDIEIINNYQDERIILVFECARFTPASTTPNYFVINLGKKNRLKNIQCNGPSTSGDLQNYSLSYFNTNNDFSSYFTTNTNVTSIDQTTEKY